MVARASEPTSSTYTGVPFSSVSFGGHSEPASTMYYYTGTFSSMYFGGGQVPTSTYTATFFTSLSEEALRGHIKTLEILTFGD